MNKPARILWLEDVTPHQAERKYCSWWCEWTQMCWYEPCRVQ